MKCYENKYVWITWERQIRNHSLSKALGVALYEILSPKKGLIRYAYCISQTFKILFEIRPLVVVCQNPSIVLTILMFALRYIFRFKLVIDAHFGGVEAYNGKKYFQQVLDICNRWADLVIVTNDSHAKHINKIGGVTFTCQDLLPDIAGYGDYVEEEAGKIFFICSFDNDEPFLEVFKAAKVLYKEGFNFYVSGNYHKANIEPKDWPWVKILGYIPEQEFYRHLFSSQFVIDLTDNENCLVCGAYEALAAGKPIILSNKKALKNYFNKGTIFTENSEKNIIEAVRCAHAKLYLLKKECVYWIFKECRLSKTRIIKLRQTLEAL